MSLVLVGNIWFLFGGRVSDRDLANKVAVFYNRSWFVDRSRYESGSFGIWGPKYDG